MRTAAKGSPRGKTARSARGRPAAPGGTGGAHRLRVWIWAAAAGAVTLIALLTVALATGLIGGGPRHVLSIPAKLGSYDRRPQLEQQMNARQLQQQVIARSAGQASHVVSAVYENNSTSGAKGSSPQMFLLIGGNLAGTSADGFISSFQDQFKGAAVTGAGPAGGEAACVNAQSSVPGSVALCVWADNDTFGVLASPTMHSAQLGAQLRAVRPGVEHVAK